MKIARKWIAMIMILLIIAGTVYLWMEPIQEGAKNRGSRQVEIAKLKKQNEDLKKENKKLTEENKKLKEESSGGAEDAGEE